MSTDLVVFDLDGVLIDSRGANVEAFACAIEQLGLPRPEQSTVTDLIGMAAEQMLLALGCPASRVAEVYQRYVRPRYLECILELARPVPGAHALLQQLRSGGRGVAACTSGALDVQEPVLRAHGLWEFFQEIQAPDRSRLRKPDPAYLGELVDRFEPRPQRVVHVEDTQEGCLMGRRWGAVAVFAEYGFGRWDSCEQPDHRIASLSELAPIIFS